MSNTGSHFDNIRSLKGARGASGQAVGGSKASSAVDNDTAFDHNFMNANTGNAGPLNSARNSVDSSNENHDVFPPLGDLANHTVHFPIPTEEEVTDQPGSTTSSTFHDIHGTTPTDTKVILERDLPQGPPGSRTKRDERTLSEQYRSQLDEPIDPNAAGSRQPSGSKHAAALYNDFSARSDLFTSKKSPSDGAIGGGSASSSSAGAPPPAPVTLPVAPASHSEPAPLEKSLSVPAEGTSIPVEATPNMNNGEKREIEVPQAPKIEHKEENKVAALEATAPKKHLEESLDETTAEKKKEEPAAAPAAVTEAATKKPRKRLVMATAPTAEELATQAAAAKVAEEEAAVVKAAEEEARKVEVAAKKADRERLVKAAKDAEAKRAAEFAAEAAAAEAEAAAAA